MNSEGDEWTKVVKKERKGNRKNDSKASSACAPPNARQHGSFRSTGGGHHNSRNQRGRMVPTYYFSKEKFLELIKSRVPNIIEIISSQIKPFQMAVESSGICTKDISLVLQVLLKVSIGLSNEGEIRSNSIKILNELFTRCYHFQSQLKKFVAHMPASDFKESDLIVICDLFYNLLEKLRETYWMILPLETLFETVTALSHHKPLREEKKITLQCIHLREFCNEMKEKRISAAIKKSQPDKEDHIWDNSEYRDIEIIPQWHEIDQVGPTLKLRPNVVSKEYDDWMHYYDVQFRLLREDFIGPLRKGITDYRAGKVGSNISNVRVYRGVQICGNHFTRSGLCHTISFDISSFRRINWEYSKRLIFGSLLCLSPESDNFKHSAIFAVIKDRSTKELESGKIKVMFSEGTEVLVHQRKHTKFVMVESIALYEASSHILRSLQRADDTTMPFTKYLIKNSSIVDCPKYLKMASKDVLYNLCFIIKKEVLRNPKWARKYSEVRVLNKLAWPSQEETILDESQLKAMKMALMQEVVVIQGPPGTGKTYIGLKIVQALLDNQDYWSPKETRRQSTRNGPSQIVEVRSGGPILIMCFTNHALDQFLEGILDLYKDKNEDKLNLVRVGSRSKSDVLKSYNLIEVMKGQNVPYKERNEYRELEDRMKSIKENCISELARYSDPVHQFVEFSDIRSFISEHHIRSLKDCFDTPEERDKALEIWLGLYIIQEDELSQPMEFDDDKIEEECQLSSESSDDESQLSSESSDDESQLSSESSDDESQLSSESSDDESECDSARSTFEDSDDENSSEQNILEEDQRGRILERMREMYTDVLGDSKKTTITKKKPKIKHNINRVVKVVQCKNYNKLYNSKTRNLTATRYNDLEAEDIEDVNELDLDDRWELYKYWHSNFRKNKLEELERTCQEYNRVCEDANKARQNKERFALENAQIIGMTTTGTAKYQHILHMVKPKIVIVEEAAEVMESHIVSALNAGTQQLILIGDHRQLRPKPNDYDMIKKYKLDISLFERLVKKEFPHATLENQHRMRPEIAQLVHPHIYKTLHNHESVLKYPKVGGISKDLYFICHNESEHTSSDQSHANEHEANYLIALCLFILKKSHYKPTQITILVTYTGQLLLMRNKMLKNTAIKGVRISTVDNFQGEENDIILLSLVRSNDGCNIGFLKEENRVCVALSRARHGFYCIGNFKMLQRTSPDNIWHTIIPFMEMNGNLGYGLEIHCVNHPKEKYLIHEPEEFEQKSPRGGCTLPCGKRLNCGHTCPRMCHLTDPDHLNVRCSKPCPQKCAFGHECKLRCWENCFCIELVEKEFPKCKHKRLVQCSIEINHFQCEEKVAKEVPGCGHVQEMACHRDPNRFTCLEKVVKELPRCGHEQTVRCGENVHFVKCSEQVLKTLPICNHTQYVMCYMNIHSVTCNSNCDKICPRNLHKCGKKCHKNFPCSPCMEKIEAVLKCGHLQQINCGSNPELVHCMSKCERECIRGHKCKKRCYETCRPCMDEINFPAKKCGHINKINCFELERFVCTMPVPKKLKCGHIKELPCADDPNKVKCSIMVPFTLLKCGHTLEVNCWEEPAQVKCCKLVQKTLRCGHVQEVKCFLEIDKIKCPKKSMRELECRHEHMLDCCVDLKTVKCNKICQKNLECGHVVAVKCYERETKCECTEPCTKQLPCNHSVTVPCNQLSKKQKCMQKCGKKLSCGHQCKQLCFEECSCTEIILRNLFCGHTAQVLCQVNTNDYKCKEKCKTILSCGHKCKLLCYQPCTTVCKENVPVVCKQGHKRIVECNKQSDSKCIEKCTRLLPCQHACRKLCYEQCTTSCRFSIRKKYPCGHVHRIPCCSPPEKYPCDYACKYPLSCGHPCNGKCSDCFSTRIHKPCTSSVGLKHFCGDKARLPCLGLKSKHTKSIAGKYLGKIIVCNHKQTPWKCSSSFDKCLNRCDWSCPPQCPRPKRCTKMCSELCDRLPCNEPCLKIMKCGQHHCIGLCGEKCISVCPICEHRLFKSHLKKASEYCETERYIQLQCGHIFTVAHMDNYILHLEGDHEIHLLQCPACSQPMSCNYRYGNAVKESFQDIVEVKGLIERKSKGNRDHFIQLYADVNFQVKGLCPQQLIETTSTAMKKIFETKKVKEEEGFLLYLIVKVYHLVRKLGIPESAAAILDNLLQRLLFYLDGLKLSFQIIYDLLSEYYRLSLVVMATGKTNPVTVMKHIDRINSNPQSRISTEDFDKWSRQLDACRAADVQCNIDNFIPRIRNGIWMKCRSRHYYCIPVTQTCLQIERVQCYQCIGSYSASISIEVTKEVKQRLQKSVDISEELEKAIMEEIRREQEEAEENGGEMVNSKKENSKSKRKKKNKSKN